MTEWSGSWKSSKKPGKQRKYRYNAPLHIKRKFLGAHLSKELRQRYGGRSVAIIKGDKVKVARGQFWGHAGKIDKVDVKKTRVFVTGIEIQKKDGSKTTYPINPSNLIITELNLADKKRNQMLDRKKQRKEQKESKK
jgi:large subunit ribosomal protein L24